MITRHMRTHARFDPSASSPGPALGDPMADDEPSPMPGSADALEHQQFVFPPVSGAAVAIMKKHPKQRLKGALSPISLSGAAAGEPPPFSPTEALTALSVRSPLTPNAPQGSFLGHQPQPE
jgi:hypothetical protein